MKLSQKQIAMLWISQGGSWRKADEASAVAMAESGGDTEVYNGICCYGLWQFNVRDGVASKRLALDATRSTRKAVTMSRNGRDWSPWEAQTNGNYRAYLGKSGIGGPVTRREAKSVLALNPLDLLPDESGLGRLRDQGLKGLDPFGGGAGGFGSLPGFDVLEDVARFFVGLGELILTPEGWLRLGKILFGVIALLAGVNILIRETSGVNVGRAAAAAAPVPGV